METLHNLCLLADGVMSFRGTRTHETQTFGNMDMNDYRAIRVRCCALMLCILFEQVLMHGHAVHNIVVAIRLPLERYAFEAVHDKRG